MTRSAHRFLAVIALLPLTAGCRAGGREGDEADTDGIGGTGQDGGSSVSCEQTVLPDRRVRRLSHHEYVATVRDLVGPGLASIDALAPDNVIDGYANDPDALLVSGLLAEQYRVAAESIADAMVADLENRLPCDPADGESGCAATFLGDFAGRAFRRPPTDDEMAPYLELYDSVSVEDGFEEGLRWTIAAILQSPHFLYRTELGEPMDGDVYALTSHELASALSYAIVGTAPDDELRAAADADALREPEQLRAHAERLIASAGAAEPVRRFADAWLRIGQLELVTRDETMYPDFTESVRAAMRGETERLITEAFTSEGTLRDLLLADHTFVTDELAAFYGIDPGSADPDAGGFRPVALTERYGGLLTQGSVLSTHALPNSSSPIHRGVLVRERLLCHDLPPPPPGVANAAPEVDPSTSTRQRYDMHSTDPTCAGCHRLIDGIGFAFEHYDGVGRWRDDDGPYPVDATGEIIGSQTTDATFDGVFELSEVLADSSEVSACFAQQYTQYSMGSPQTDPGLACMADEVVDAFAASEGKLATVILAIVTSDGFRLRRATEAVPPPEPEPEPEPSGSTGGTNDDGGSTGGDDGPKNDPALEIVVTQNAMWPTGECNDVSVTNISVADVTWIVRLPLEGTITTVWEANWEVQADELVFSGIPHNATLAPGHTTAFGFCHELE